MITGVAYLGPRPASPDLVPPEDRLKPGSCTGPTTSGDGGPTPPPSPASPDRHEWGGVCGSYVLWRHGASGTACCRRPVVLSARLARPDRSRRDGVTSSPRSAQAVNRAPAELVGDAACPSATPAAHLYPRIRYFGSACVRPAHPTSGPQRAAFVRPTRSAAPAGVDRSLCFGRCLWPIALHAVHRAGDRLAATCWPTCRTRIAPVVPPSPPTGGHPPSSPPTSPTPRSAVAKAWAGTRPANLAPATPCPRTPSCVQGPVGRPAGGVLRPPPGARRQSQPAGTAVPAVLGPVTGRSP